jgi:acyl-CoA synthetase (AMP-forming)/AMP-acid ligase II
MGGYLESHENSPTQSLGSAMTTGEMKMDPMKIDQVKIDQVKIGDMNIREMIGEVVGRRQAHVFLIDAATGREITYGDFHRQACALAAELRRRGLRKSDRIAVMLPNSCELAILYFACIYLGAVIVPTNPSLSKSDVQFILESCKPALIVAGSSSAEAIKSLHANVLTLITAQEAIKDARSLDQIEDRNKVQIRIDSLADAKEFVPLEIANAEDLIVIMYTSGTSAKPKGLAHKLGHMFRNALAFAVAQRIDQDSRFYLTLSMAYMGGFYNLLVLPLLCGASVVVDHVFDARSSLHFWDKAKNSHVNTLWLAPTVLSILLRMDRGRIGEEFCRSSVRHAFVGFAPLPLKVKNEFEARYGVHLIENYGLSETLFVTARSRPDFSAGGYVGESLPGVELRIASDNDSDNAQEKSAAPGVDGEVQILTPDLMAGYLDAGGALSKMNASAWFTTGDVGHLDERGSLFITGRKKDLIIRGGVNISPAAIEESLMHIPGVVEVAVVSIPHELYGEDVVAVLKLDVGVELETILDSVVAYAKRNLAQHQQPARYISIDELPRTANGKVQKARIRELVAQKLQVASTSTPRIQATESISVTR